MRWIFGFTIVLSVFLELTLLGQGVNSAAVSGIVRDESGSAIVGATVLAKHTDRNQIHTVRTNGEGRFQFLYLPVGNYDLSVEYSGFAAESRKMSLFVGQALAIEIQMAVAGVAQSLEVQDQAPTIELVRTQVAATIVPREIDALPLNGRNYLDLALLSPAVSRTNTGNNERFAETSAVPGTGISIAGQRNLNNGFVVDGMSSNDDAADLAGTFLSQEVIREFQVVTSGGVSEYGRASGGVINIVTHSGTNQWRGRLYGFMRNQRLDARNAFAARKDPLTQTQYGATVGGPILRDRSFIFSNFEQTRQNSSGLVTISDGNVFSINQELDRIGYAGSRLRTGSFPAGYDTSNVFIRTDHRFSDSKMLAMRYSLYDISSINARGIGGLNEVSRGTNLENRDQTIAVGNIWMPNPVSVNETRFQFTRSVLAAPGVSSVGPAINVSGIANFGPSTSSPTGREIDTWEVSDALSTIRGHHSLKTGINFLHNRVDIDFPGALPGIYSFSSIQNLRNGTYSTFQQAFGEPGQIQGNPNLGLFVQDEWKVRNGLTLNYGVRYDLQWLPSPIHLDRNNIAPRFGIAIAPSSRTVIRASYGLFFDRIPLRATSNALQRDGRKYNVAVLAFGQTGAPAFPQTLATFPQGLLTSITTIHPNIENSYAQQANLQIERELATGTMLSVGYLWARGVNIVISRNINVPTLSAADATRLGIPNLGRPDPTYANISRYESIGDFYYNGMTVSFTRLAGSWANMRMAWTLSKAIDTAGNAFFSQPQNAFDIRDERGLSNNDQRHRLTLSGTLNVPRSTGSSTFNKLAGGFQLSSIFTYSSPLPFNVQTGNDRNFDTNVNDRPSGIGRNTGVGFDSMSLDVRLSRQFQAAERFRVEVMVEGFNVLNRTNKQFPNNNYGAGVTPLSTFGLPTAAGDPRQLQFGLRLGLE